MDVRTFTNTYSQVFHHKGTVSVLIPRLRQYSHTNKRLWPGVNLSPQEHAQGRLAVFRQTCVNAALLDPGVGSVQYTPIIGNGTGNQWAIYFNDEKFNIVVHYDVQKRHPITKARTRTIGYTLSVTVIQECRPMADNDGRLPRHISVSLV